MGYLNLTSAWVCSNLTLLSLLPPLQLNNIGRVHYMKGHHAAALEWYQRALSMRRHLLGDDHLDVAATIYNAGQTHHQQGQLQEAMRLYQEFLRIAQQRLGVYHRDVAVCTC